jgi:hypothetical protein
MADAAHPKMELTPADAAALEDARAHAVEELLSPEAPHSNVVGVAAGVKWRNGEPTGDPAVLALVTHKVDKAELPSDDLVPAKIGNTRTDVLEVGFPMIERAQVQLPAATNGAAAVEEAQQAGVVPQVPLFGAEALAKRARPAEGGYSVGHFKITAGTIATCVYDLLPGAATGTQPRPGVGMPQRFYILSNNHVLANVNAAMVGDPILQPGPFDGGTFPADLIARLSRFIPITLEPPTPRILHRNLVDAAVAEGQFHDLDREIYWGGYVRGWRRRANVAVGTIVQKTGRTTNFTTGRITAINATVDVGFGGGRIGRFQDQIITTNMSAGGDSGSLVVTPDEVAVGLLFAGSSVATIANQIENVRSLLRVEVAEQIL